MKNILFIGNVSLSNPSRGTPLRIYNFLQQMRKHHRVVICCKDVGSELDKSFVAYPSIRGTKKLNFFASIIKEHHIDFVFTATEVGIRLPVALKILTGVCIGIDLHGLYAEELYLQGSIGKWRKRLYDWQTKFFLTWYDVVFVVSKKLGDYYRHSCRNVVIFGGVENTEIKEHTEPPIFTIGYMGNTRSYQGLNYLLEALDTLKRRNIFEFRLNLILSGNVHSVSKQLAGYNLADITTLHTNVSHADAEKLILDSSVLVVPRPSIPVTEFAFPSKFSEYLMSGIPVITTEVGPIQEVLAQAEPDICMVIEANNIAQGLEKGLERMQKIPPQRRAQMSRKAALFARDTLCWDILGKKINKAIEAL